MTSTVLHRAIEDGFSTNHFGRLLAINAGCIGVDTQDHNGCTPLHRAALLGIEDLVRQLLDAGANVNILDHHNQLPLHCSIRGGRRNIVRWLLDAGSYVNIQDKNGMTPLHVALLQYPMPTPTHQLLLNAGAEVIIKDKLGETALDLAKKGGNRGLIEVMLKAQNERDLKRLIMITRIMQGHGDAKTANAFELGVIPFVARLNR